jgi:ATP-dependent DNA helicase PIF1
MQYISSLKLTQNMRIADDNFDSASTQFGARDFANYLLRVGEGSDPYQTGDTLILDQNLNCQYVENYSQVIDIAFGSLSTTSALLLINTTVLTATNAVVDQLNNLAIMKFPGEHTTYLSEDEHLIDSELPSNNSVEHLNNMKPPGMPPHELKLKIGQPIMCLRNINPKEGLCNGTRLIVRSLMRSVIEAEIAYGDYKGKFVFIPRITLHSDEDTADCEGKLSRTQFPVQSAFAMTINKAQGQTLENVVVSLLDPVFSHGQLYVALSRVTALSKLKILLKKSEHDQQTRETKNVVFQEVLSI